MRGYPSSCVIAILMIIYNVVNPVPLSTDPINADEDSTSTLRELAQATSASVFEEHDEGYLYQGDMMLSKAQAMGLLHRNMIYQATKLWPRNEYNELVIDYTFNDDRVKRPVVENAIQEWEAKTCLRFNRVDYPDKKPHISFRAGKGCWSYIGMTPHEETGGHKISIDHNCDKSATIHEIGHAVGMYHEQSRSDRDEHVIIFTDNADPKGHFQFQKEATVDYGVPYDYYSTMHYGSMFFSSGGITIRTKKPLFQTVIGGDSGRLSFMDAKLFNLAYKCIDDWEQSCPYFVGSCLNGGYVKMDPVCRCDCPEGTEGTFCEHLIMDHEDAILAKYFPNTEQLYEAGTVSTPLYPGNVKSHTFFTKYIEAPYCQRVVLVFTDLDMAKKDDEGVCSIEHLEVRTTVADERSGVVLCGGKHWYDREFRSVDNVLILNYYSVSGGYRGFKADYYFEKIPNCVENSSKSPENMSADNEASTSGTTICMDGVCFEMNGSGRERPLHCTTLGVAALVAAQLATLMTRTT